VSSVLPAQRLHGWSWLFHAARVLKEVALPLLILVLLKREDALLSLGLAGTAAALACAYGWLRARSVRYELLAEEIVIREGLFAQELRHVPFGRIQSVSERRGLLHRALGVTELVLESGSGGRPEAVMRVLDSRSAAQLAEALRLHRAGRAEPAPAVAAGPVAAMTLLDPASFPVYDWEGCGGRPVAGGDGGEVPPADGGEVPPADGGEVPPAEGSDPAAP
jgi:putative membrane protein